MLTCKLADGLRHLAGCCSSRLRSASRRRNFDCHPACPNLMSAKRERAAADAVPTPAAYAAASHMMGRSLDLEQRR